MIVSTGCTEITPNEEGVKFFIVIIVLRRNEIINICDVVLCKQTDYQLFESCQYLTQAVCRDGGVIVGCVRVINN